MELEPEYLTKATEDALHGFQKQINYLRGSIDYFEEKLGLGLVSDGYHTHNELYGFREVLHAHAVILWQRLNYEVVKSWRHHDGEECFGGSGWFIVTAQLPTGQVSNHYPMQSWDLFKVPEVEKAPEWDGHDAETALERMRSFLV